MSYTLGGWYCKLCRPGEFCFNNTNRTCPEYSSSFQVAKSLQDCFCNAGYKNTTVRTEQAFCEDCPANSFCTGKGMVEACVANAVSPRQSTDHTKCYCDWGYKGLNNTPCVACQSPTFCYAGVEAQCSEGTFSPPLSWNRLNCSCIPGRWGPAGQAIGGGWGKIRWFNNNTRVQLGRAHARRALCLTLRNDVHQLIEHLPHLPASLLERHALRAILKLCTELVEHPPGSSDGSELDIMNTRPHPLLVKIFEPLIEHSVNLHERRADGIDGDILESRRPQLDVLHHDDTRV